MEISKGAIGVLAGLCLTGGAGTVYFATRSTRMSRQDGSKGTSA